MFINGEWQIIIVDDFFPLKEGKVSFGSTKGNVIWIQIFEKAFAKASGGYSSINGLNLREALSMLIGLKANFVHSSEIKAPELFE